MAAVSRQIRAFLILGRVSNLPTVWSNCLAGWLLGGGGDWARFGLLCAGATLLYLAGMFLNDAFDAPSDRQRRQERPIPSGAVREKTVWRCGFGGLVMGLIPFFFLGRTSAMLAVLLALAILLYDAVHKILAFSPVLMAQCRFLLYLLAASAASGGVTGLAIWSGLALGLYVLGLSFVAQKETVPTLPSRWPVVCLVAPIVLAVVANAGPYRPAAILLSAVLAMWSMRALRQIWWTEQPNPGRAVAALLAGIVWVDWLAIADQARDFGFVFIGLFLLALVLQRYVPAT